MRSKITCGFAEKGSHYVRIKHLIISAPAADRPGRVLVEMDLSGKKHMLSVLSRECTKPKLRSFEFEELSQTVRHRIFREVLLKPKLVEDDSTAENDEDSYPGEHEKSNERRIERAIVLMTRITKCIRRLGVPTGRSTKKPLVSCMENWFTWDLYGCQYQSMWLLPDFDKTLCRRHYSRLITKMCLNISTKGEKNGIALADVMYLMFTAHARDWP